MARGHHGRTLLVSVSPKDGAVYVHDFLARMSTESCRSAHGVTWPKAQCFSIEYGR